MTAMATMMVGCKNCGNEFPFGIQADESSLKASVFKENTERFPNCERDSTCCKSDYFLRWRHQTKLDKLQKGLE
jgi:hypothetical protein